MARTLYHSVVIVTLVALMAASAHSQSRRSQVRATRRSTSSGTASGQGQAAPRDPNLAQQQQDFQQRMAEMQRWMAEMQRQAQETRNNAIRQTLHATDEQWPRIKAKLDLIERLKAEAAVSADLGSGATSSFQSGTSSGSGVMGGWMAGGMTGSSGRTQTWGSSGGGNSAERTDGQVLCERLLRDVQNPGTPPAEIVQRVAALRRIRSRAQEQLAQARKDLRSLIAPAQEPALVAMGYLD
ncbi:MAG: hypothetical protein JW955_13655 [Sedimentisphaerales bacterium]|nr:hypothetical protein [Sedimentisphaerales bacterium]